jgi:multicomponent Na+:H+ antiporter subunit E
MTQRISLFALLFGFWLLLSGYFTPFLVAAGLGSAAAVVWLAHRMRLVGAESLPVRFGARLLPYWLWMLKEILKSGWQVARIVLDPRLPISPTMIRFRPSQHSAVGRVVHANSITLTPGTITVEADTEEFVVHGLTRESAEGCIDSEMDRRIAALERA